MWYCARLSPRSHALLAIAMIAISSLLSIKSSESAPTVHMAWDSCNPSNLRYDQITRELYTSGQLQIWVLGQESPSQAYTLDLEFWNPTGNPLPDAWRYDPEGCQPESLLTFIFRNPMPNIGTCGPGLAETRSAHKVVFENAYDSSAHRARIRIEVHYSPPTSNISPSTRYRLARLYFTQAPHSVFGEATAPGECGGLEEPVCFRLTDARYQDSAGQWIAWPIDGTPVTAHGEGTPIPVCDVIPVRSTTWGTIKANYR